MIDCVDFPYCLFQFLRKKYTKLLKIKLTENVSYGYWLILIFPYAIIPRSESTGSLKY